MKHKRSITILTILIVIISAVTTSFGIFSSGGPGVFDYESIRGEVVKIYGQGVYRHMSADVAIQGIAQDYVTLFIGIPLLLISLVYYRRNSIKAGFVLSGTFLYFLVTFMFYTAMGMYNIMFLGYVALFGLSFFALFLSLFSFKIADIPAMFSAKAPSKPVGIFLMVNAILIALLWLGEVVPPLLDGSIYPAGLDHYTTLIVQGFDLGLLLPISFVVGLLLKRKMATGYLFGIPYIVFLSLLMTALTAKIIAMGLAGVNIIPAVIIIPVVNVFAVVCAVLMIRCIAD